MQYNQALDDGREAWVNSAQLPQGIKKDLKNAAHAKPVLGDLAHDRLPMLAQQEVNILDEHHQMLRDQAMFRSYPDRDKPRNNRGGKHGGGRGYNQGCNQDFNRSSGYRGRGQNRVGYIGGYRGRGRHVQLFSDTQFQKKSE